MYVSRFSDYRYACGGFHARDDGGEVDGFVPLMLDSDEGDDDRVVLISTK